MCCLCGACELVKLSFSRLVVYLIQLVLIVLAGRCLFGPSEWIYVVLFKNSTIIQQYLERAIPSISIPNMFGEETTFGSTTASLFVLFEILT